MVNDKANNINVDNKSEIKVNLDTILVNEIGQFGKFQIKTLALLSIIAILISWGNTEYVFTTARISTRCFIPECDVSQPEWSPHWLPNAVPVTNQGSFDNCQRFGNSSALIRLVENATCPSTLFDKDTLQPCDEFVYENTHSIVYNFNLACDEWRRTLVGTVDAIGTLISLPISGYISDKWGRRVALVLTGFNKGWLGLVRYWSNTYIGFTISEFSESVFGSGSLACAYILLMELVGPKYRVGASAGILSGYAFGQVLLGLIAWTVPNWRNLTLVLYTPSLLLILYFWLIPESARWYMSNGRFEESEAILKEAARQNGKTLSESSLQVLRYTVEEEIRNRKLKEINDKEPWLVVQVFRHKRILLRCIVSPVWWITTTFIFYGLSINAVNIWGNKYFNFIAVSAVEIPGYWTAFYLLDKIGRKPVLIGSFWCCAACQITYIFLSEDIYAASLTVYLIGKYAIAIVVTSVYTYTSELYPTRHRHRLFSFSSMLGRIGSILAPLTPAIGAEWFEELPFILFASFAFLSGALIFLTPETLGTTLPDTMEQASNIGQKETPS